MARSPASPRPPAAMSAAAARYGPLVGLVAAALALIVAEFVTFREIVAATAADAGWDRPITAPKVIGSDASPSRPSA